MVTSGRMGHGVIALSSLSTKLLIALLVAVSGYVMAMFGMPVLPIFVVILLIAFGVSLIGGV